MSTTTTIDADAALRDFQLAMTKSAGAAARGDYDAELDANLAAAQARYEAALGSPTSTASGAAPEPSSFDDAARARAAERGAALEAYQGEVDRGPGRPARADAHR